MNNKVSYTHQYLSRTETFEKKMEDFSAGQKKKVLIAKSLCEQAHLYVWDEPLNYVDIYSRMQIENLIKKFSPIMIFVEHDLAFRNNVATRSMHKSARVCHLHGLFPPFRRRFSATLSGLLATQTVFLNNERGTSKNAVTTFKEVHRNDGLQENSYASKYGVQPTRNGTQ